MSGLKHHVMSNIHAAMCDNLSCVAFQITSENTDIQIYDKGWIFVGIKR